MSTAKTVLADALRLPRQDRADLARELIASLDEPADANAEQLWLEEIQRRLREIEAGTAELIPWETVRARIEARLRSTRQ